LLYIYLKSYNSFLLNAFCEQIFSKEIKKRYGIKGPIFLPKKQKFYTVTRSPHIYSLSKETFEIREFQQLFVINLYSIFKREFPENLRRVHYIFYEWLPMFLLKGQSKNLLFQKLLSKKAPAGVSLKFTFK
jgi:ribosomal protein S10